MKKLLVALAVCVICGRVDAADLPGSKDNPFIKRFEGAEIVVYKTRNYDQLSFFEKDPAKMVAREGRMVRILFRVAPDKTSSLEVFRNYEEELKAKGFDLIHSGSMEQLGISKDVVQAEVQQGGFVADMWSGAFQNAYDIYAVKHDPAGDIHLRVSVFEMAQGRGGLNPGEVGILVDSLQIKAVTNKMVDGTAGDMAKKIAAAGSVLLYGIYFDNDQADLKPQSKPTLDEVGKLMTGDPALKLKVVGHTDNLGTAEHNQQLSTRRAAAVTRALVHDYNIASERLTPFGAGATQPVASNDTEEGRAKNRRVELVKI
jgi:OOP family OmpA-OmpF porin